MNGGAATGHRNGYAIVWKCGCGAKTAIMYSRTIKRYDGRSIDECLVAVSEKSSPHFVVRTGGP